MYSTHTYIYFLRTYTPTMLSPLLHAAANPVARDDVDNDNDDATPFWISSVCVFMCVCVFILQNNASRGIRGVCIQNAAVFSERPVCDCWCRRTECAFRRSLVRPFVRRLRFSCARGCLCVCIVCGIAAARIATHNPCWCEK